MALAARVAALARSTATLRAFRRGRGRRQSSANDLCRARHRQEAMCTPSSIPSKDQSCVEPASDINETFRGNLDTSTAMPSSSQPCATSRNLTQRSRSDGHLSPGSDQQITFAQLALHNSESHCWLAVKGKVSDLAACYAKFWLSLISTGILTAQVYDVTGWTTQHPGGQVIVTYAGKDATDVFACFHAATSWAQLKKFYIGDLVVSLVFHVLAQFA